MARGLILFVFLLFFKHDHGACTGVRGAKRASAQEAARDVYKRTARRLTVELRAAGMVLESNDGWER